MENCPHLDAWRHTLIACSDESRSHPQVGVNFICGSPEKEWIRLTAPDDDRGDGATRALLRITS
jgi:hypothetical protein